MQRVRRYSRLNGFILSAILILTLITSNAAASARQDLPGTWNVIGELVASTAENPNDPYAPKPGSIKPDTWVIHDSDGSGPVLKGSAGSISGQYTDNGAAFEGTYPLSFALYQVVRIECVMSSSTAVYGTIENEYWGTNTITGEMLKAGIESWKFTATKQ